MLTNGSTASLMLCEWYVFSQSKEITNWFGLVWANYKKKSILTSFTMLIDSAYYAS